MSDPYDPAGDPPGEQYPWATPEPSDLRAAVLTLCDFAGRFSAGDTDVDRSDLQVAIDEARAVLDAHLPITEAALAE